MLILIAAGGYEWTKGCPINGFLPSHGGSQLSYVTLLSDSSSSLSAMKSLDKRACVVKGGCPHLSRGGQPISLLAEAHYPKRQTALTGTCIASM
jgi:hypothetical protein